MMKLSLNLALLCFLSACGGIRCHRGENIPPYPGASSEGKVTQEKNLNSERVFIYKYDGSLQCGMKKAIPLEKMKEQLGNLAVFSMQNKADGLMHIQACGASTGRANIYEILREDLKEAQKKGFKEWSFSK